MPDAKGHIKGIAVPRIPWHEQRRPEYPLLPYQYEIVFACLQEPLSAYDISCEWRWRQLGASPQAMANRMRPLVRRGWLARSDAGIYRTTKSGRRAVSW